MRRTWRSARALALALVACGAVGAGRCGRPTFAFLNPEDAQLSLAGPMAVSLLLPKIAVPGTLAVRLDGQDVTGAFTGSPEVQGATLAMPAGAHVLEASVDVTIAFLGAVYTLGTRSSFDTVTLQHPDECEVLNDVACLLPYPSSRFLAPDATTPTGYRLQVPAVGLPALNGAPLDPAAFSFADGFAPTTQVLVHFPGGVDLLRSNAPRLLPAGCCGQPSGPPWIDTRTLDERSLEPDSPTVILDAETGERVLHFAELDSRAAANPARQALILRPGRSLTPGRRYIVALRGLVRPDGSPVVPEAPFAALRDGRPTDIPTLVQRRAQFEDVFARLERFGVPRAGLQLAFDFVTQSDHALTHQMLEMRDQAFAWLAAVEADPAAKPFTVTSTTDVSACTAPTDVVWKEVAGTFQSPLFLQGPPIQDASAPALELLVDAHDVPVQNGFMDAPFTISIPCAALDPAKPLHPLVLGHGAFGTGDQMARSMPGAIGALAQGFGGLGEWSYLAGATDWQSICCAPGGLLWIGIDVIGIGSSQLHHFAALPDRTKQGELNTLVLARLMKRGLFDRDPAFQVPDGLGGTRGAFPGASAETFYYGISLGGINGLFFSALTPDVTRFHVDVPAINFSQLLQRSTLFASPLFGSISFESILASIGLSDPLDVLVGYDLINEIWVSGEPGGYATHITSSPLPGSGVGPHGDEGKKVLLTMAWLDKTVPNLGTEVAARTLGLPQLEGSLLRGMPGLPDVAAGPASPAGLDSAFVVYDLGAFDLFDPNDQAEIPPLANAPAARTDCDPHGERWRVPAGIRQQLAFLQPGGTIRNTCTDDGLCDASEPFEIPGGAAAPCQLPAPPPTP